MKVPDHVEMDRPAEEEWPSLKKDVEEMLEMRIAELFRIIIKHENRINDMENEMEIFLREMRGEEHR